jgi:hypothetical protein
MTEYFHYQAALQDVTEACSYGPRQRIDAHRAPDFKISPADIDGLRRQAFDIGWDFSMYGLRPENGVEDVFDGYLAGCEHFGKHGVTKSDVFSRKWLRLRASANSRQRIFDSSVTPDFLRSIATAYCPITRKKLEYPDHMGYIHVGEIDNDAVWTVDRLNNEAGYIDGNLVVMSRLANTAKHTYGFDECRELSIAAEKEKDGFLLGLNSTQWARLAYLTGIVDDNAAHEEIACLPMLCLVPNNCQIRKPSAIVQMDLMQSIYSGGRGLEKRVKTWCSAMPSKKTRNAADDFAHMFVSVYCALSKKVSIVDKEVDKNVRWLIEDTWTKPVIWKSWSKLMKHFTFDEMRTLAKKLHPAVEESTIWDSKAGLDSRGYSRANDVDSFGNFSHPVICPTVQAATQAH